MAWTQRIEDTFTDTNGTEISAHTPDQGDAWVEDGSGSSDIFSNSVRTSATPGHYRNTTVLEDKQAAEALVATAEPPGLYVRMQSGSRSGYFLRSRGNPFFDRTIYRVDGGSLTGLESDGNSHSNNDVIRLEADGDTITAYLNGGTPLVATDSTYASGSVGLGGGGADTAFVMDNFKGYDEASVAFDPSLYAFISQHPQPDRTPIKVIAY